MRYGFACVLLSSTLGITLWLAPVCVAGPGRPSAATEMAWGRKDMERGHWTGALSHFRKALGRDPHRADIYADMGRAYRRLGDVVRAKESYSAALKINPHNDSAETGLHDVMTSDEHEKMMADIVTRVAAAPQDADLQTTYAEELFERDRFDEAAKAAQTALSLNGKESHAEGVLGLIALHQNRTEEAMRLLKAAAQADDFDDDSWAGLGDIYTAAKDYPNAVASYRHAVIAAPDHAEWHEKLAALLTTTGDTAAAATQTEAARSIRSSTGGAASPAAG